MGKRTTERSKPIQTAILERRPILRSMLDPKKIALIGATEAPNSVGRTLMENLVSSGRIVYPINPKRTSVLGVRAFPKIEDAPATVDLAIIATPAATVPEVVGECASADVTGAVIVSVGFRESGSAGLELEKEILNRRGQMRLIGPNCLGVMIPPARLNATFAKKMALEGSVAFISQSGALGAVILDWSLQEKVGFSVFLSSGSMLDVGWGDLIYYLDDDPFTRSILIYMESIGDARSFLSAAREVAIRKPIIVIKSGITEAAARAVASHTGTLAGDDAVLNAAFRRAGVLRVNTIADLFHMAEVLSKQPRPNGPRLAIVTNAGGPGVLATDMLVKQGGEIAPLSEESIRRLDQFLPGHWSRGNPVDLFGDATPDQYVKTIDILRADPGNDGLLVIVTPQVMTDATGIADGLHAFKKIVGKPMLANWMGVSEMAEGEAILHDSAIPTFKHPDTAARSFCYMWRYSDNLRALYETPELTPGFMEGAGGFAGAAAIIDAVQKANRTLLTEVESKQLLDAYRIPTVPAHIAESEEEAVRLSTEQGPIVVLKLYSEIVTHKADVGGVKLNLRSESEVRRAYREIEKAVGDRPGAFLGVTVERMIQSDGYELILGSSVDPQFGPILLFGSGGRLVEIIKDYTLGFPPLNRTLARRLMEQTLIYRALKGVRAGAGVDLAGLERLLVQFSLLVAEQRRIKEIDINPLLVSTTQILALDARIVLHDPGISEEKLPRLAIRPYPQQYVSTWKLKDGSPIVIRPIRPEDEPMMVKFHRALSDSTVHFRYFGLLKLEQRIAHDRLVRMCFNDYDREIAIIGVRNAPETKEDEIIAVGRLIKIHEVYDAEYAIILSDRWQGHGLGTHFMKLLLEIGRQEGVEHIFGQILRENQAMQRVCKQLGFAVRYNDATDAMEAKIKL
jgi:acetyltransferase